MSTDTAEITVEAAIDAGIVCTFSDCDKAADVMASLHMRMKRGRPDLGCRTGDAFLCDEHWDALQADWEDIPYVCHCGQPVTKPTDAILWHRRLR